MEDIKKNIEKYDCWLKKIWDGLGDAIAFSKSRPEEENIWVGRGYVQNYQKVVGSIVNYSAKLRGDFDLAFLNEETVRNLSEDQLWDWAIQIAILRDRLQIIRQGKE